jgi:hypothetical protein
VDESGNPKVVLTFGFKNHHHHVHVSNTTDSSNEPSPEVKPTTNDISKEDLENLTKNMGNIGSDFKRDLLKKMLGGSGFASSLVDMIPENYTKDTHLIDNEINRIKNLMK